MAKYAISLRLQMPWGWCNIPNTVVNILAHNLLGEYFPGVDSHTTESLHPFVCPMSGMFLLPSQHSLPLRITVLPPPLTYFLFFSVTIKNLFCSYRRKIQRYSYQSVLFSGSLWLWIACFTPAIHSYIHLFTQHLLSSYFVLSLVLGARDTQSYTVFLKICSQRIGNHPRYLLECRVPGSTPGLLTL